MKRFVLAGTVTLVAAALLGGCVGGTDNGDGTSKTLSWALGIANDLADAWNEDHKITLIVGMWLDAQGELGEQPDNPAWGIFYTADDDSEGYGVLVHYDGHTESNEVNNPKTTGEVDDYTDDDVKDWMQVASEEMGNHPDPLEAYDYALSLFHWEFSVDRDYVTVYFFQEDDQDTDYDPEEWENFGIFKNFYAWVLIDATNDIVVFASWWDD